MSYSIPYLLLFFLFCCSCMFEVQSEIVQQPVLAEETEELNMKQVLVGDLPSDATQLSPIFQWIYNELKSKLEEWLIQLFKKVAFGATLGQTGDFGPFNIPVTLVYKKVYVNQGGAYNPTTGIFTAPVKGVYFFSFSGHGRSSKVLNLGLFKNGQQMLIAFNHPLGDRYESASNSICLTLEKGDAVYVRLQQSSWVFDDVNQRNSFAGHLLFTL